MTPLVVDGSLATARSALLPESGTALAEAGSADPDPPTIDADVLGAVGDEEFPADHEHRQRSAVRTLHALPEAALGPRQAEARAALRALKGRERTVGRKGHRALPGVRGSDEVGLASQVFDDGRECGVRGLRSFLQRPVDRFVEPQLGLDLALTARPASPLA